MAKKGMKRPEYTHTKRKNETTPVPEIEGQEKHGKNHTNSVKYNFDNDLANENLANDISEADLQDL